MRLGFACMWDRPPEPTWSHTPWQLRAALRELGPARVVVVDLDLTVPRWIAQPLRLACARRRDGRWVSMWRHSRGARWYTERALRRAVSRSPCDAVLEIGDLGHVEGIPYFLLQDFSFDALLGLVGPDGEVPHFPSLGLTALTRLRDRQRSLYRRCAGIFAMSAWLARELVERSGVPQAKVVVVHPGGSAVAPPDASSRAAAARRAGGRRTRLLSVGADFPSKGGRQVLEALALLRARDPEVRLTVAGPTSWPFPGQVPDGVDFVGRVPLATVLQLYDSHDLFVLPSVVEGFGIVFAEALSRGLPCIARRAFAMPEIVEPGVGGLLVEGNSPEELADVVRRALLDDELYARCAEAAASVAAHFSWRRAAEQVVAVVSSARAAVDRPVPRWTTAGTAERAPG